MVNFNGDFDSCSTSLSLRCCFCLKICKSIVYVCFVRLCSIEVHDQSSPSIGSDRDSRKGHNARADCPKGHDTGRKKRETLRSKSRMAASFRSELASRLDEEYCSNSLPRCAVKRKTVNAALMGQFKNIIKPPESKSDDDEDEGIGSAESLVSTPELEE